MDLIIEYTNLIYEKDKDRLNELPLMLLIMKYKIEKREFKGEQQFIKELYNTVITPYIVDIIKEITEEHYIFQLDELLDSKYDEALQFTDEHAKILMSISTAIKLIIPICLDYASKNHSIMNETLSAFFLKCFDGLFAIFSPHVEIQNKLYHSVYSRVIKTKYSDSTYWYYIAILGSALEELVYNLSKKLVIEALPKYTFDKNVISFNHVYIANNIKYSLKVNFPIKYKIISLSENTDDTNVADIDKMCINMTKLNESIECINKISINDVIAKIKIDNDLHYTADELAFYKENVSINRLQRTMLFLFYGKYFYGIENLYNCNIDQYIELLLIMKKKLIQDNFNVIPMILTAKTGRYKEKKSLTKKNLLKVVENPKYKDIIESKYTYSQKAIIETSQIIKEIGSILVNKFMLCDYGNELNGEEIIINSDNVIEEILRFIETI